MQPRFRFTVGQVMGFVASCAVAQAIAIAGCGLLGLLLLVLGGVVVILARASGMTRVRAAAWVFSAYPLLAVGVGLAILLTWDRLPESVLTLLSGSLSLGFIPAFWLSLGCVITEWVRATAHEQDRTQSIAGLLVFALVAWAGIPVLLGLVGFVLALVRGGGPRW